MYCRPRNAMVVAVLLLLLHEVRSEENGAAPAPPWAEGVVDKDAPRDHAAIWQMFHFDEAEANPKIWVRPEYVLSWIHSANLPALVTTGLTTDSRPGAIGNPYTSVLYGSEPLDYQDRHGFRITVGGVVSAEHALSIEGSYLTLGGRDQRYQGASPGSPVLARPFLDVVNNQQDSGLVTYPGLVSGTIGVGVL